MDNLDVSFFVLDALKLYHSDGPGRPFYDPEAMVKALFLMIYRGFTSYRRLARHLAGHPSDAMMCGFNGETPEQSTFSRFYKRVGWLFEAMFYDFVAQAREHGIFRFRFGVIDSTDIDAYSQRDESNRRGRSDPDAAVGKAHRRWFLGYNVHTICDGEADLPVAFKVAPANVNEKRLVKPLLDKLRSMGVRFKRLVGDKQYCSRRVRLLIKRRGMLPTIPWRKRRNKPLPRHALKVDKTFRVYGPRRMVEAYHKHASIERLFSRAKGQHMLNNLRFRGIQKVEAYVALVYASMLALAIAAYTIGKSEKVRSLNYFLD